MSIEKSPPAQESPDQPLVLGDGPGLSRRQILRSAASVPLLATIPAGAALAASSAYQCVLGSQYQSNTSTVIGHRTSPDTVWVRRRVPMRIFARTGFSNKQGWLLGTTWYGSDGQAFDPQPDLDSGCSQLTDWCSVGGPFSSYVLEVYNLSVSGDPTTVYSIGSWSQHNTAGNGGPAANFALTISCLCSVNPGLDPNSPPLYCQ